METFDALAGRSRQVSKSAQMQALNVACWATKHQIQSVEFVRLRTNRLRDGPLRERLHF
jgi:hypothetical protein